MVVSVKKLDSKELSELEKTWKDLFQQSTNASMFMSWPWIYSFLEGDITPAIQVLAFYKKNEIIGLVPYVQGRLKVHRLLTTQAIFLPVSHFGWPSHLDIIAPPQSADELAKALWDWLEKQTWNVVALRRFDGNSPFLTAILDHRPSEISIFEESPSLSPLVSFPQNFGPLFCLPNSTKRDLNKGHLSPVILEEFKNNGQSLSSEATMEMIHKNSVWEICQGEKKFLVKREGPAIQVHFNSFLESLTKTFRKKVLQKDRQLSKKFQVDFGFVQTQEELGGIFDKLVQLHTARMEEKVGASDLTSDPKTIEFHRRFCRQSLKHGSLRLSYLRLDGEIAVMSYDIQIKDQLFFYNVGLHPKYTQYSLGNILTLRCIEKYIDEGLRQGDFMASLEYYKFMWAHHIHRDRNLVFFRSGLRGWLFRWLTRLHNHLKTKQHRRAFVEEKAEREKFQPFFRMDVVSP